MQLLSFLGFSGNGKGKYLNYEVYDSSGEYVVHRSIEIKSMKFKAARDFAEIKRLIVKHFGEVFKLQKRGGYVIVSGDLHDYRTREKLYEIITSESIGG